MDSSELYQCPRRTGRSVYRSVYTEYLASIYPGNWDHGAAAVVAVVGGTGSRLQDTDTQVAVLRHTRASDQQHLL